MYNLVNYTALSYLPSKKLTPTIIASLIVLTGVVVATLYTRTPPSRNIKDNLILSTATSTVESKIAEIDTDADGLKDWEEQILGTDVKVKDTDADGTQDNDEVKAGRDPLKKGPNDSFNPVATKTPDSSGTLSVKKDSETEKIAQQFFVEYMSIKKSGGTLSETQQQQIIENLLTRSDYARVLPAYYSLTDFQTIKTSKEAMRAYGNALANIMIKNSAGITENELAILEEAVGNQDKVVIKKLDKNIAMYKGIVKDLLALPVPAELASSHIELTNSFSGTITYVESFRKVFDDPALALSSVEKYMESAISVSNSFDGIEIIIKDAGIKYTVDEPAYSLFEAGV